MKQSRVDFIKEAHSAACSTWKERIEKEFPKIFEQEFKVGDWVIACSDRAGKHIGRITKIEGKMYTYNGWNTRGEHEENDTWLFEPDWIRKATPSEIESHLIEEAKRRGYKNGNHKCLFMATVDFDSEPAIWYQDDELHKDTLWMGREGNANKIYHKGKWAEIIDQTPKDIQDLIAKYGKDKIKEYL